MAERDAHQKRYAYQEMSNKVEQADRTKLRSVRGEPTGEVESLWGRDADARGRMGDRLLSAPTTSGKGKGGGGGGGGGATRKPADLEGKLERARKRRKRAEESGRASEVSSSGKKRGESVLAASGGRTILDLESVSGYQPTDPTSRGAYEALLTDVGAPDLLGAQPADVLRDAAGEVLGILKDDGMRDPDRHDAVSRLLTGRAARVEGGLSSERYARFVALGKKMADYGRGAGGAPAAGAGGEANEDAMDDEMGVAVVFDDSDEEGSDAEGGGEGGGGSDLDEVVGSESSSDEEGDEDGGDRAEEEAAAEAAAARAKVAEEVDEEEEQHVTLGRGSAAGARDGGEGGSDSEDEGPEKKKDHSHGQLSVHDIDAHWLQRKLSVHYDDADVCSKIADDVLAVLRSTDVRECENRLLVLLGFELFDLIKLLLDNRAKIWACVTLKRAGDDELKKKEVEAELRADPTGRGAAVWDELHSQAGMSAASWAADRMNQATSRTKREAEKIKSAAAATSDEKKGATGAISSAIDDAIEGAAIATAADGESERVRGDEAVELDLESIAFRDGSHVMSNKKCTLPDGSWRATRVGYEEVHVPAVRHVAPPDEKLIDVSELPKWTRPAFEGMDRLNRVQSKMCQSALYTSENLLLCAPTGAGKTNVAMLAMLNVLGQYRTGGGGDDDESADADDGDKDDENDLGTFDLRAFKIVYVAPMKALVQEVVKNFGKRLAPYGVTVRELSGDSSLTRQQISETQLLVTTPEKWDIVTRQGEGRAYTQLVRLVVLDEVHLLHDDRGPVLESLVSRTVRQIETTQEPVRLVGLSATLPNYGDVATFLRVKPDKGLFFFDQSYRPVPLQQQYIGITERSAFKRFQLQNEICYEKCLAQRKNANQVIIFVHSRAECGKTARALRDLAAERDQTGSFVREGGATQEILREEVATAKNADLRDVLASGFAVHHAGMARSDRELVEDLFADRHVAVLCSTATLAWGVNLPAHAVIIRGTQIYDPKKGRWAELSPLDVLQMLGRAGRPQYDSEGEGIILTAHSELQYYLSLMNVQLPIESQLIRVLPDHLNAEIVLGNVGNIAEAVDWLSYSFLYVRMLRNPSLYGIHNPEETLKEDPTLRRRRLDLVHTAACLLEKSQLVRYDRRSGALQPTPLGRVSSHFYISHLSMAVYGRHLRPNMADIELLRLFSLSGEFAHITVREEEKLELAKLAARVPIPVKESPAEPSAKVNILLQAYISRLKLEGFALVADMAFIQQSAARIMRALFEIALKRNWAQLTKLTLSFANMVSSRVWKSQSPLRQFKGVPEVVTRKLERKSDINWSRYADLTPQDLGELVGVPKMGRTLHRLVHQFPKVELSAHVQPITRSMLRVELKVTPDFQFDVNVHGYVQLFHILVEDVNGEITLHHENFALRSSDSEEEHTVLISVPILDPLPPQYYIRVISDRWLHSETMLPISFRHLILPAKFPPPTELLDLQPLPITALGNKALTTLYESIDVHEGIKEFNPIQTQSFHELFKSDRNALVCAPTGSGKTVCAEFAILRMLTANPNGKCVYVAPREEIAHQRAEDWKRRFGTILGIRVRQLTGETAPDLRLLGEAQITVCTVPQWDALSRRWRQRKAVQAVSLFIMDELHLLGGESGPTMEVVISRMRYLSSQLQSVADGGKKKTSIRIVGLSASLANAREVGEWMGVPSKSLFNFSPKVRPVPLEIYLQSFDVHSFSGRMLAMGKPVYNAVVRHSDSKPVMIFVPSRRQAQLTAIDLMTYGETLGTDIGAYGRKRSEDTTFLGMGVNAQEVAKMSSQLREPALQQVVSAGIGFLHEGMVKPDWDQVVGMYRKGTLSVLVCPYDLCWKVPDSAHLVIIMGTESYDGREKTYVDYPIADLLQMMGKASRPMQDSNGKCVILCHTPKKERLKKLLYEPLPIESHLDHYLHDHMNSEIVTKTIGNMQDAVDYITWTLLYRRLTRNPNYYNLQGTSSTHLSEHISEMVETVIGDLEESKCCEMNDDGDVAPLNLGMIAAYYYIQYTTIELIASSVTAKTKTRGVMEILSAASEFSNLPIRQGEEKSLRIIAKGLKHKLPEMAQFNDPNTKALILLHCHFSRKVLSTDLRSDQKRVVGESVSLIQAIVDVISSNGWLKPALAAMELSQMVVQALWNKDHVLLQIPHFTKEIIDRCEAYDGEEPIESVFDILSLEDDVRNDLLRLPDEKMADVAVFCNNYPNIDVAFEVEDADEVTAGDPVQIFVTLEREIDEDEMEDEEQLGVVSAPLFPKEKREGWWIVVGDTSTNSILSLKRVSLRQKQKIALEFIAPEAGDYNLTLFCMSDSYLGCDQEYSVPLSVAVGESDEEDSDDDEENGEEE